MLPSESLSTLIDEFEEFELVLSLEPEVLESDDDVEELTSLSEFFFLAQTKMSWRSLLTSQYSR
jgi:hypothetical protein